MKILKENLFLKAIYVIFFFFPFLFAVLSHMTFANTNTEVLVDASIDGVVCDLMYAKDTNFTGRQIYKYNDTCFLHKDALDKLKSAVKIASKLGYKIKIADSFRPIEAQQVLWNYHPNENFVSNPAFKNKNLGHCRGASLDVTLIYIDTGKDVPMGTSIDHFGDRAYTTSVNIDIVELKNRMILTGIMTASGFVTIPSEWWHFNLPNLTSYPIIEGGLKYVPVI